MVCWTKDSTQGPIQEIFVVCWRLWADRRTTCPICTIASGFVSTRQSLPHRSTCLPNSLFWLCQQAELLDVLVRTRRFRWLHSPWHWHPYWNWCPYRFALTCYSLHVQWQACLLAFQLAYLPRHQINIWWENMWQLWPYRSPWSCLCWHWIRSRQPYSLLFVRHHHVRFASCLSMISYLSFAKKKKKNREKFWIK